MLASVSLGFWRAVGAQRRARQALPDLGVELCRACWPSKHGKPNFRAAPEGCNQRVKSGCSALIAL
eukprot:3651366-Alexandrium_andersonii.AAC.1